MTYDPATYWRDRGTTYAKKFRPARYVAQETALREALSGLDFDTVLDVGCGFGRMGSLIAQVRPGARYTGVDVSPDLIRQAQARVPGAELIEDDLIGWDPDGRTWDLVIAAEVLMHIPKGDVRRVARKLRKAAGRYLVTVDWDQAPMPGAPVADYNFVHDYESILGVSPTSVGSQGIYVVEFHPEPEPIPEPPTPEPEPEPAPEPMPEPEAVEAEAVVEEPPPMKRQPRPRSAKKKA